MDAADESAGLDAVSVSRNGENESETMSGFGRRNIKLILMIRYLDWERLGVLFSCSAAEIIGPI